MYVCMYVCFSNVHKMTLQEKYDDLFKFQRKIGKKLAGSFFSHQFTILPRFQSEFSC